MATSRTGVAKKRASTKSAGRGQGAKRRAQAKTKPTPAKASIKSTKLSAPRRITAEERIELIRESAFLRAEKRGFLGGNPVEDWLQAEKEIDAAIQK